ncbi:DUF2945 domain-containing protein [Candidatus Dependentiae bacterium]|nr:DUF2945 domain-containing protein [Candidatus Dependentiae bacterium]
MAKQFKVGDQVEWNSSAGIIQGTVEKEVTSDTTFMDHTVRASAEEPQYLVKSDKTGHFAMHKGSALTKITKG